MNQLYARVFTQILDSSLAENWQARHVFEDLLKLAEGGIVDMTREAIVRRLNIPREVIDRAISVLESPDPSSRDPSEDGRRVARLDDHRNWGWRIVNWDKYEAIKKTEDQRAKTAERVRRFRERQKVLPTPSPTPTPETETETEAEAEAPLQKRNAPLRSVTGAAKAAPSTAYRISLEKNLAILRGRLADLDGETAEQWQRDQHPEKVTEKRKLRGQIQALEKKLLNL